MILHTSAALVGYFFTKYIPVKRYYLPGTGKSMPIVSHAQDFLATTEGRCECEGRVVSNDALIYARSEGELIPCLKLKKTVLNSHSEDDGKASLLFCGA